MEVETNIEGMCAALHARLDAQDATLRRVEAASVTALRAHGVSPQVYAGLSSGELRQGAHQLEADARDSAGGGAAVRASRQTRDAKRALVARVEAQRARERVKAAERDARELRQRLLALAAGDVDAYVDLASAAKQRRQGGAPPAAGGPR